MATMTERSNGNGDSSQPSTAVLDSMTRNDSNDDNDDEMMSETSEDDVKNQFAQARKALKSIGNNSNKHCSNKHQLIPFALKLRLKQREEDESLTLVKAAEDGNFAKVISIVASKENDLERQKVMNGARIRHHHQTNVNSNNNKSNNDWYDLTPLAIAALHGHSNIVEYFLRQGADPTLRGSPSEEEDYNAMEAAQKGVKSVEKVVDSVLSATKEELLQLLDTATKPHNNNNNTTSNNLGRLLSTSQDEAPTTALAIAQVLVEKLEQCRLCLLLLKSVESYWPRAANYSSHYRKRTYTNKPTDIKALRSSLDAISMDKTMGSHCQMDLVSSSTVVTSAETLVNRLATKISSSRATLGGDKKGDEETNDSSRKVHKPSKIKRRGRRYSDSFMLPISSSNDEHHLAKQMSNFKKVEAVYA